MPANNFKKACIAALILITCILLNVNIINGQIFLWRSITFQGEVRDMLLHSGDIWAVTGGGLFIYDTASNSFRFFNNTTGLSSNNPSSFVLDNQGRLWIGMDDGSLNVIRLDDATIKRVPIDPEPIVINDVAFNDNSLYLALDFGISHFLTGKEEIKATFRNLGSFTVNTGVHRLFVTGSRIWAGTEKGIATALLTSPNLQDPQFWDNYTTLDGLPSNNVTGFTAKDDTVFAGTGNGVVRISDGTITSEGLSGRKINRLANLNGEIFAASDYAVSRRVSHGNWVNLTPNLSNAQALIQDDEGNLWAGHKKKGMYVYNESVPEWINVLPPGPGGNTFEEMVFDGERRLWCATGQAAGNGVYIYDNFEWEHLASEDGLVINNTTGIEVDHAGRIWVGTPGAGLMILEKLPDSLVVIPVDTTDKKLGGAVTPAFVVVNKILRGAGNIMWIVNKYADNGKAIVAVTHDDKWYYFSLSDGLVSTAIRDIAFDNSRRLWIATENDGVNRFDYSGTLENRSDDIWKHITTGDKLTSNRITALAADREFGMWIGTEEGINYYIDGLPVQNIRGAIDGFITAIAVDPANNKWFGTPSGISVLSSDNFTWEHYTSANSGLVDNNIISILFDEYNGDAYIGTGKGLSILKTPFKNPPPSFNEISTYPSPFVLDGSGTKLTIENLPLHSTVIIATISGKVIRELSEENGGVIGTQAFWDGRDGNYDFVPTGIYIIAAGVSGTGHGRQKIAVIRK